MDFGIMVGWLPEESGNFTVEHAGADEQAARSDFASRSLKAGQYVALVQVRPTGHDADSGLPAWEPMRTLEYRESPAAE